MGAAVHQAVLHAKMVARGQGLVASGAGETAQVVDRVSGTHDHLGGGDAKVAAGTSLHREPSGKKKTKQRQVRALGEAKAGPSPTRDTWSLVSSGPRLTPRRALTEEDTGPFGH